MLADAVPGAVVLRTVVLGASPAFAGCRPSPDGALSAAAPVAAASRRSNSGECAAATLNRPVALLAPFPAPGPDVGGAVVVGGAVPGSAPDWLSAEPVIRASGPEPSVAGPRPGPTIVTPAAPEAIRTARVTSQNVRRPPDAAPTKAPRAHRCTGVGQKSARARVVYGQQQTR